VKDSWEDEENEKNQTKNPAEGAAAPVATKKKSNKRLEEKIAEKERKEQEEAEERRRLKEENMTAEERLAEKLHRQRLVEESDFEMARETFGLSSKSDCQGSIDNACPSSKEDFDELKSNVVKKLQSLSVEKCYNDFMEDLVKELCVGLDVETMKKISLTTKSLHEEKLKMVRAANKGSKKGKTKLVLKMDKETDNYGDDFGGGEYDDFM